MASKLLTALICATASNALPQGGIRQALRDAALQRKTHKNAATAHKTHNNAAAASERYFTQRLDHYDASLKNASFQQRYFVNSTWYKSGGPVFLCVGGEGPALDASVVSRSVHCSDATELAPEVGSLIVALEHRYYGKSIPPSSERGAQRLRHLTSHQAVADIAVFHKHISDEFKLPSTTKWIAFGGSYPGMVAGFSRLRLPHLIHAAVSSSAPWHAKVDMTEYNDRVGAALANEAVGGSDACQKIVVDGHAKIKNVLESSRLQRMALAKLFNFCNPLALENAQTRRAWAGYGVVGVPAQSNDPASTDPGQSIGALCSVLLAANTSSVDALATLSARQRGGRCVDASLSQNVEDDGTDALSWPWQTCAEFGFYQTCEVGSQCPFARGYVSVADEISICSQFGLTPAVVASNVAFSNEIYGGAAPMGSRILFPNGDVDPWTGLGVLQSPAPTEPVMMVVGASHHAWTHPADTIVQKSVADAKGAIQAQVKQWLAVE
jgi:serine protease 16